MPIDLRSDTVTRPTEAMRAAIASADVGDDVYGDDPTVNRLEEMVAELLGFSAAMFVPSGTASNLCALLSHCQRGEEYLVGQTAHTYKYEGGGAAVLGSIQPQPVTLVDGLRFDLDELATYVKADDVHFARTKLLSLENTKDGRTLPHDYVEAAQRFARERGLSLHLDGARLWNAAVADRVEPSLIADGYDSVSVCLSKGLGAPVGSVLVGADDFILDARRWRKMIGGGMRQAGMLAAGGIYAVEHHIDRLADDHRRAAKLAAAIADIDGIELVDHATNMVFARFTGIHPDAAAEHFRSRGITISPGQTVRFVLHLDIDDAALDTVIDELRTLLATAATP